MKLLLVILCICAEIAVGQELPALAEQQLENLASETTEASEDDAWIQELETFRRNPVNLNNASAGELKELRLLNEWQITNLLNYRDVFGYFLHVYELQAIPSWDPPLIRKLLPFITIAQPAITRSGIRERVGEGQHSLVLRLSRGLEKANGYDSAYLGSPLRMFFRYRYAYKNLLQYGITGDKDGGEQFLKGSQKAGFDFYSFHLFARHMGIIQSIALGDFTVNMGQGLIQWQSLAFKKSADVVAIRRQSAVLRPYTSAGEFNFHRGAGITLHKKKMEATFFASIRKISANVVADTGANGTHVSSFQSSGLHRTVGEMEDRNRLGQLSYGTTIRYTRRRYQVAVNAIGFQFSLPVKKRDEPYNLYAWSGSSWANASVDYSYTWRNIHFFGEIAVDRLWNKAWVNGMLMSVDPRVDLSLFVRSISPAYQAINANAFTENSTPVNENGIYAGIAIRPANAWRMELYADCYRFPWLRYLVDAPSGGRDFLAQLLWQPSKTIEWSLRFRSEVKQANSSYTDVMHTLAANSRRSLRVQGSYRVSTSITLRNRVELLRMLPEGGSRENGFLLFADCTWRPPMQSFSIQVRWQYFETDSYDSRLYAYENDVLYSYSIPAFDGRGQRYYLSASRRITRNLTAWLRIAQTVYTSGTSIGSGTELIENNHRTDVRIQLRYSFP